MPFKGALKVKWAEKSDTAMVLRIDIEGYRNDGVSVTILVSTGHVHESNSGSHTSRLT